jgi:hypothetical protein
MALLDDRLQIDKFYPPTWTGDFGANHDGFPKNIFIDGSIMTAINEEPVDYSNDLRSKPMDLSGNVHLKTIDPSYADHAPFPSRKFEYSDGAVTWYRPQQPWPWMNRGEKRAPAPATSKKHGIDVVLILFILVIVMFMVKSK